MSLKRDWTFLLLLVAACGGGGGSPGPVPAPPPAPDNAPRLIRFKDKLYVKNAPAAAERNTRFYAREALPVPGTSDHPKIGILSGVDREGSSLVVAWVTVLDENVDKALAGEGLPVDLIGQDVRARLGRHWGEYLPQPAATFPKSGGDIVLELDLGRNEDVRPGDHYEVLGEPRADALNQRVDSFEGLGTCTVQPFGADTTRARCQVDRGIEALKFGEKDWLRGGYVQALTRRPGGS